ncbi:MAG: hypothetical protein ACN4EH_10690 [Methyloceanibacter sp.]|jgi:hypothetical protein
MRMIYLAFVMFGLVLVLGLGVAQSDAPAPQQVADAAMGLSLPGAFTQLPKTKIMSPVRADVAPLPFCGQCSQDSDCGTGHKCCGPSSCLECFRVVTCP